MESFQAVLEFHNLLVYNPVYRYTLQNNGLDIIRVQLGVQIEFS